MVPVLAARYAAAKQTIVDATGAQEDLLHVHVGLLIFLASALLLRKRLRSPWPVLSVIAFALANELLDFLGPKPWNGPLSLLDVVNTILWPLLLFLVARRTSATS